MNSILELVIQLKDEASKGIGGLDNAIGAAAKSMALLGAAGVTALAGFVAGSVKAAGDFEGSMLRFKSVAGGSMADAGISMDAAKAKALDLGMKTQYSAGEALDAMINLAKGGVPIKGIMGDATDAVLNLAGAGEVDLAQSAEIVAKQLGAWGESGVTATDVANIMAQAANASTTDVDKLALGLYNMNGAAKATGLSFAESATSLALIAPQFNSSATAGTAMASFLTRLVPQSDAAAAAMSEIGLVTLDTKKAQEFLATQMDTTGMSTDDMASALDAYTDKLKMSKKDAKEWLASFDQNAFFDAQGKFIGMGAAAEKLKVSLSGMSNEQRIATLQTIFGSDAMTVANALADKGGAGYAQMAADMAKAGTAAEQSAEKQKGFNFAMESLKGTFDTIMIVVGDLFLPVLTRLMTEAVIPTANAVLGFAQELNNAKDKVGFLLEKVEKFIPGITEFVKKITEGTKDGVAGFDLMNTRVGQILVLFLGVLTETGGKIIKWATDHKTEIVKVFTDAWDLIKKAVDLALTLLEGILNVAYKAMHGDMEGATEALRKLEEDVWEKIKALINAALELIKSYLNLAWEAMKEVAKTAWDAIKLLIKTRFDQIKDDLNTTIEAIKKFFREGFDAVRLSIVNAFIDAYNSAIKTSNDFIDVGKKIVNKVVDGVKAIAGDIADAITSGINSAIKAATDLIDGFKRMLGGLSFTLPSIKLPGLPTVPPAFFGRSFGGNDPASSLVLRGSSMVAGGTAGVTNIFNIDLRGSDVSEQYVKSQIQIAFTEVSRRAEQRARG